MFKKQKISKINNKNKYLKYFKTISILVWIVWVFLVFIIWFWITKQVSKIDFSIDNLLWFSKKFNLNLEETEVENTIKKTDWKTNILIIWRWWEENEAPELTDSIIIASINYEKQTISMFSIPRDLYVEYPSWWNWKINEAYFQWLKKYKDEFKAINNLKEILKRITKEEIHYFVNLDFDWFRKIIDTLWGIEVNVPKDIVDTAYPGPNYSYQTFKISAWLQTLDWETALKYARSRHSTSDFDRSLRQQLIIKAIRDKILSIWVLTSPSKIRNMFDIVKKYVKTDLEISQIISLWLYLKDFPKENIVSSNLNDSCFYWSDVCEKWWFLYAPLRADFWWTSVMLVNWSSKADLNNYDSISKYTNIIFNYPKVYSENIKINVFNSTKIPWLAKNIANKLRIHWFNVPKYNSIWNTWQDNYEKSKILYVSWSWQTKPETIEALELFIFWWTEVEEKLKYSKDPEVKIEIIIWNDYKYLNF